MILETKRDLLRVLVLENGYYLDSTTYRLLKIKGLQNVISKINEKSLIYNVNTEGELNASNFINLLNRFVEIFKDVFINMLSTDYIIEIIIDSNKKLVEDYFFNFDNSDKKIVEKIYKLIINNFISNSKYINCIKELLNERKIKLKEVDNYSLEESKDILKLLSDLAICKRNRSDNIVLFENIEQKLNNLKEGRANKKYNYDYYKNICINNYENKYSNIYNAFNKKKKYLKYFN